MPCASSPLTCCPQVLDNPLTQSLMSNPDVIRQMLESNPQMQEVTRNTTLHQRQTLHLRTMNLHTSSYCANPRTAHILPPAQPCAQLNDPHPPGDGEEPRDPADAEQPRGPPAGQSAGEGDWTLDDVRPDDDIHTLTLKLLPRLPVTNCRFLQ